MKMNTTELKHFRKEFEAAVLDLEVKYGVKIEVGNFRYDDSSFHTQMTVRSSVSENGEKIDLRKMDFEKYCWRFGLRSEDYMKEVHLFGNDGTFIVIGVNPNASKNVITILDKATSKKYVCPKSLIREFSA